MIIDWRQFFENQDIGSLIVGLTALLALLGITKRKNYKKTDFRKSLDSNIKIDEILKELEKELENTGLYSIPAVAVITNGGERFKFTSPLYIKTLNCNYDEVLQLWGKDATPVTTEMKKTIRDVSETGNSSLQIKKFNLDKVESWANTREINNVFYFLIGYKRKSTYLLAINSNKQELTDEQKLIIFTYTSKLKSYMNSGLKWYQEKIHSTN